MAPLFLGRTRLRSEILKIPLPVLPRIFKTSDEVCSRILKFAQEQTLSLSQLAPIRGCLRIPVKWAADSGDVGQNRSEATLVAFYVRHVAHMSQEKGK
ncbi:MAG: hypothetical protein ACYCSP_15535 [Acidobacteriaceae bacterium]